MSTVPAKPMFPAALPLPRVSPSPSAKLMAQQKAADVAKWNAAAHPPPAPYHLPNSLASSFAENRNLANESYQQGLVQNNASQNALRNSYVQQFRNLALANTKNREAMPYNFNQSGMLGSGVYHQGLQDLAQNYLRSYGDMQGAENTALGQFHLNAQQLLQQRDQALASIENQRQQAIATLSQGSIK